MIATWKLTRYCWGGEGIRAGKERGLGPRGNREGTHLACVGRFGVADGDAPEGAFEVCRARGVGAVLARVEGGVALCGRVLVCHSAQTSRKGESVSVMLKLHEDLYVPA